jgi:hypothetical protein
MSKKILKAYPFLEQIPGHLLAALDLDALYLPTAGEKAALSALSALLKKQVVIYRNGYTPRGAHLCRTIRSATLNDDQLNALLACEAGLDSPDKVLVAYEDPVDLA